MDISINIDEMPRSEENRMINTIIETAKKWFELPEVQEDFQRWKEQGKVQHE